MKISIKRIALLLSVWAFCNNIKAQCPIANTCEQITVDQTLFLESTDQECEAFITASIASCLDNATPNPNLNACDANENPTVWFAIQTLDLAEYLVIAVDAKGSWKPTWSVYSGDCSNLTQLNAVAENGDSIDCGQGKSAFQINISGNEIQTYLVAVSGLGDIDDPDFTVSAFTVADCIVCVGDLGHCETSADFSVVDRNFDSFPIDTDGDGVAGPFFPGEEVTICLDYFYDATLTSGDWLIGFVPTFGDGWDLIASNVTSQNLGGSWEWFEAGGDCAPLIQEQMPNLCTYTDDFGKLQLCNVLCETCPCSPPMIPSDPLPSGWYWVTTGGLASCANDCSPGEGYGLGTITYNFDFCLNLKVKNDVNCQTNNDLSFSFQTFSDQTAGCWDDPIFDCYIDNKQIGPEWKVDCNGMTDCLEGFTLLSQFECSCDAIENDIENLVICDLPVLDSYVFTMPDIVNGNGPSPLCSDSGVPHNITWLGFVAGEGDFDIEIIPLNCVPGSGGNLIGMQIGIYGDCSFTEEIWCTPDCTSEISNSSTQNIDWIPGETYYMFFDGCAGSICEVEINIICNSGSCDPFAFGDFDISLQECDGFPADPNVNICLGGTYQLFSSTYDYLDPRLSWEVLNPSGEIVIFEDVDDPLEYTFDLSGEYTISLVIENGCSAEQKFQTIMVNEPSKIFFENFSLCEGESGRPNDVIGGSLPIVWDEEIIAPDYILGESNIYTYEEIYVGHCGCLSIKTVELEVKPNAQENDTLFVSESEFPIDYNGVSIPGPVDSLTISLEQAAANGCDSIINLTVFVSTDVLDIDNTEISIYPNPSYGLIHIEHNTNIQFERLEVIDIHGRSVKSMPFSETVDLSDASSGLYFLKLMNIEGQVYYHNVIID